MARELWPPRPALNRMPYVRSCGGVVVALIMVAACSTAATSGASPIPATSAASPPSATSAVSPPSASRSVSPTVSGADPSASPRAFLHIVNRSAIAVTVGPELSIAACGRVSTSRAGYDAARNAAGELALAGMTWEAPAGALVWDMAIGFEPTDDLTVVISGALPPAVRQGVVADADLPQCGGNPVGIVPGLPQGATVTVTPLP